MTMNQEGFPVFKGLQKPLEFMGIRGRFLTLAALAIGVSFVGFILFSIVLGKIAGFIAMLVMAVIGLVTIFIKQRGGLHNKRRDKGIYICNKLRKSSYLVAKPRNKSLTALMRGWRHRTAMSSFFQPSRPRRSSGS